MSDFYNDIIIDEAQHPANFGQLDDADFETKQYNASCGDEVQVFIKLDKDKKKIQDLKWVGNGCSISQATMSLLSQKLIGLDLKKIKKMDQKDLLKLLEIEEISPGRIKCLLIGLTTVQTALNNI